MATSGSVDFSISRDDIITDALQMLGEGAEGETISGDRMDACSRRLNMMVKAWMANGAKLWAMKQATLFLTVGTASYSLGATGTHCTDTYVQTTLSTDEASGSTSLSLTSTTGMSASDNIGIVLDSGSIHWTTISGAPGAPTTIATGLAGAATSGNVVFTYTTKINRPQRIDTDAAYWRSSATQDTPVKILSRAEYAQLANKTTQGKIVQAFYDPQLTNGVLYVWPTPDSSSDVLRFWYERILEDFDAAANTPDFAIEWGEALVYGLAYRMAPSAGVSLAERDRLKEDATEKLAICMGYDRENASTFFQPDMRG
jgi:hypothetical protein